MLLNQASTMQTQTGELVGKHVRCVCVCVRHIYIYIYTHILHHDTVRMYMYKHVNCTCICIRVCMCICVYMRMHVYIYIYICYPPPRKPTLCNYQICPWMPCLPSYFVTCCSAASGMYLGRMHVDTSCPHM